MPSAYSPAPLKQCYDTVKAAIPNAQLGGIYANKPGYHNARNQLPPSDYSVQKGYDQGGDGWAASALDITLPADKMKQLTQRLIDATFADDPRMRALREFFGTVNGSTVTGLDVPGKYWVTSDSSHLWHIHLSSKRSYTGDESAWADVAAVLLGGSTPAPQPPPAKKGGTPMGDVQGSFTAAVQPLTSQWRTLNIDDKGNQTLLWGPASWQALAALTVSGLPAGASAKFCFAEIDVKSDGSVVTAHQHPTTEVLATKGDAYAKVSELANTTGPASGYASRRVRLWGLCDEASDVKVTRLALRWATD